MLNRVHDVFKPHKRGSKERGASHHCTKTNAKFFVPYSSSEDIAEAIEANLKGAIPFYIVEHPSQIFRMFLSIDIQASTTLSCADVSKLMKHISDTLIRFYPVDVSKNLPDMFEAIVTHAPPKLLCSSRPEFEELVKTRFRFTGAETVVIKEGRLADPACDISWTDGCTAPDGSYQCSVKGDIVTLLTTKPASFTNPRQENVEFVVAKKQGAPQCPSVSVEEEKQRSGPFEYAADAVFHSVDGSRFVNSRRNARGLLCQGLHIVFPQLAVSIEQALFMREAIIDKLYVEFGTMFAPEGWSAAIDNTAYSSGHGIRVYGAHKIVPCPDCGMRRGASGDMDCGNPQCSGGKIDEKRPYGLHSVYVNGERCASKAAVYAAALSRLISSTSIRTARLDAVPNWVCYNGCPQIGDMLKSTVKNGETIHSMKGREAKFTNDVRIRMGTANTTEVHDPKILSIFEKHIRGRFVKQYKTLRVVGAKKTDKDVYFITVAGEGQHWCLNLMPPRDHKNSTIYFQCGKEGICVRCRCADTQTEGRVKGSCKEFRSLSKNLNGNERALIFSETKMKVSPQTFTALPSQTAAQLTKAQLEPPSKRICLSKR